MAYRFLIVEDSREMIETLTDALHESFKCDVVSSGFKTAPDAVKTTRPDAIILDLAQGSNDEAAAPTWDFVWKENFCPVVIHSAFDGGKYKHEGHPFRRYEKKARGSEMRVVAHLKDFASEIAGVRKLRDEIDVRIANSLREVAPLVWTESAGVHRGEMLHRLTRRRVAASLDTSTCDLNIKAVEQFVYPPVEPTLLTGDLLRSREADPKVAASYRVILTPSCDLIEGANRTPVENVLVAKCVPVDDEEIIRRCNLQDAAPQNRPAKLGRKLAADAISDMIVLPPIHGCWPPMIADLKRLELLQRTRISPSSSAQAPIEFVRVASMDSPFRERVAWRLAATAGRPGLPLVDSAALEQDLTAAATPPPA